MFNSLKPCCFRRTKRWLKQYSVLFLSRVCSTETTAHAKEHHSSCLWCFSPFCNAESVSSERSRTMHISCRWPLPVAVALFIDEVSYLVLSQISSCFLCIDPDYWCGQFFTGFRCELHKKRQQDPNSWLMNLWSCLSSVLKVWTFR